MNSHPHPHQNFGILINSQRLKMKLSVRQLHEQSGISAVTIYRVERSVTMTQRRVLEQLNKVLNLLQITDYLDRIDKPTLTGKIGRLVVDLRKEFDLTRDDLCKATGLGRYVIRRIELGNIAFNVEALEAIAKHFGLKTWELVMCAEENRKPVPKPL